VQYAKEILRFVQGRDADAEHPTIQTEVQSIAVGNTAWVGIPGELFVEIGLTIKTASPFPGTMVFGYTNDSVGYLPTRSAFPQGGYGVTWTSRVDERAEELVANAAHRALARSQGMLT